MPQMWEFVPHIVVSTKLMPGPDAVAQVVHKKLWLQTGTSFVHSLEFGFGRKHQGCFLVVVVSQVVSDGDMVGG